MFLTDGPLVETAGPSKSLERALERGPHDQRFPRRALGERVEEPVRDLAPVGAAVERMVEWPGHALVRGRGQVRRVEDHEVEATETGARERVRADSVDADPVEPRVLA